MNILSGREGLAGRGLCQQRTHQPCKRFAQEDRRTTHAAASCSPNCSSQAGRAELHTRASAAYAAAVQEAPAELYLSSNGAPGGLQNASSLLLAPEDFQLEPGEVGTVDRSCRGSAADVFRCAGCTEAACQARFACRAALPRCIDE